MRPIRLLLVPALVLLGLPALAQAPVDQFLDLSPAAPITAAKPFEYQEIWRSGVPRSKIHGGLEISRFVMERELPGQVDEKLRHWFVSLENRDGRYDISIRSAWDSTMVRGEVVVIESPANKDGTPGEVAIGARAYALERDGKTLIAEDKTDQRQRDACRGLVGLVREYFGDGKKLEALNASWHKLGLPTTGRELYIARARAKGMPVPGLKYDEMVEIWGKPTRKANRATVDLKEVFYTYGPGKELRVPFSGGSVSGVPEIVDVKQSQ